MSGRVQRRQAERFADRDAAIYAQRQDAYAQQVQAQAPPAPVAYAAPVAAPAAVPAVDVVTQLKELAGLRDAGILTEEEFLAQKAKVLA
ncbi:MAG TPA: SHOCT domain-containing protein [Acidimicrobiales bacterium]|nr:SHOCT domain-containing protein [Acidimicrobiales bacterium]